MSSFIKRREAYVSSYLYNKKYTIRFRKPVLRVKERTYNNFIFLLRMLIEFIKDNFFIFCTVAWCALIFNFSSQPAHISGQSSSTVYNFLSNFSVLNWLFTIIPIRKCAHLFLYLILEIFVFLSLRSKVSFAHILSLIICYSYACLDEFHQLFVSGRGALVTDTFIDLAGSVLGLIFLSAASHIYFLLYNNFFSNEF